MKAHAQFHRANYIEPRIVNAAERVCPVCNGPVNRIHRRLVDRLMNIVRPTYRYRCRSKGWGCVWEGNLH